MSATYDVAVLGLGAMGSAALYHLAKHGLRVVGIEQHDVPHPHGSSYGSSRVIRKAYFEDARYVPILRRAYELWHELERESGTSLYTRTGCVNLGPLDHPDMQRLIGTVNEHGLPYERLDARAVMQRFPAFRVDDDVVGVYEEDAGILAPERCTQTHVAGALARGATVHVRERVLSIRASSRGVDVVTDKRTLLCGHVVASLGPWWPSAGELGVTSAIVRSMHATRQPQLWFAPPNATFAIDAFPVFIQFDDARAYYGMPAYDGNGVKACRHGGGVRTTPDTMDRDVRDDDIEDVRGYLRRSLPALADAPVTKTAACMYTMTPDAHFVVGALDRVVVLGGFSGHGFKMASAIGEIASELVRDGKARLDISLFEPARLVPFV